MNDALPAAPAALSGEASGRSEHALYHLTDRLFRAASPEEVFSACIEAIRAGLGCTRASILLTDEAGVMRFVAAHGLSERYRRGVEGHSPWPADAKDPKPVLIEDVRKAGLDEALERLIGEERIGALIFMPLLAAGKLVGKFMAYWDAPHALAPAELQLAITIARQLGFSLERMRSDEARRSAQEALSRERKLLQSIIDLVPVMITRYEPDKKLLHLNAAFEHAIGWSSKDAAGISLMEACYPDPEYRRTVEDFMSSCAEGWMDIVMRTRDGAELETTWSNIRLSDGTQVGIGLDLTERKRGEQAMERLASIVEWSDDAIVSKDLAGVITSWNRGAERLFGYSAAEAVGKPITLIIPDDRQEEERNILERLRRGEPIEHFETVRRRRDGRLIDVSLTISPLRDRDGRIVGASKIARDITERKQAESHRDLLMAELSHRVKNTLATVISIAHQSFTHHSSIAQAQESFDRRICALAQTHTRLAETNWAGVSLHTIIRDEIAPYCHGERSVATAGPEILLSPKTAISLGLAFHELTTNAAKYGSLSLPAGRIEVAWSIVAEKNAVEITWEESGGPEVKPPAQRGFGRTLIERVLASDLRGDVQLEFAPQGLRCRIAFPLEAATA